MTYDVAINALERNIRSYCCNHDNYSGDRYAIVRYEYYARFFSRTIVLDWQ